MLESHKNKAFGLIACITVAITSIQLSEYLGIHLLGFEKSPISPIMIAIIIGISIANFNSIIINALKPGLDFCIKVLLKIGIILLGIRLSLIDLISYGTKGLIVVIPCIIITILLVQVLRKKLKISEKLSLLIAVGTSICGATAIVALAPSIKAKKSEITYAIANITIFGLFAMFLYPIFAHFLFSQDIVSAGLFLGSSIHETAQVAGSAMIYSDQYEEPNIIAVATVTKLIRNTLMVIVIPYLAHKSMSVKEKSYKISAIFPYFVIGFIVFGCIRSLGDFYFLNDEIHLATWKNSIVFIKKIAEFFLIIAMAAVGFNTSFDNFKALGIKPFYIGLIAATTVGISSILIISIINNISI